MIVFRMIARLISRGAEQIWMHKVSSTIVGLLLMALVFVSITGFTVTGDAQSPVRSNTGDQPVATSNYFKGQQNFDSQLIWASLSPELISQAEMAGATVTDLQDQLDQARELGRTVEQVAYIGAYELRAGGSMQFYVASVKSTDTVEEVEEIFYVFTLDNDGKIAKIE